MQAVEKNQRRRAILWVAAPALIAVYLLVVPIFLTWYVERRMSGGKVSAPVEKVLTVVVTPAKWGAKRFRPYYEYWRFIGLRFSDLPILSWDEMHEFQDSLKRP